MGCQRVIGAGIVPSSDVTAMEHWHLPPALRSVAAGRAYVADAIGPVRSDVAETALVVASELITNGVLHARTPITLGVTLTEELVLITVADLDGTPPVLRDPQPHEESGRGVRLVHNRAVDYGSLSDDDGKTVWASLRRE